MGDPIFLEKLFEAGKIAFDQYTPEHQKQTEEKTEEVVVE